MVFIGYREENGYYAYIRDLEDVIYLGPSGRFNKIIAVDYSENELVTVLRQINSIEVLCPCPNNPVNISAIKNRLFEHENLSKSKVEFKLIGAL